MAVTEYGETGLLEKYGEFSFTMTDTLTLKKEELSGIDVKRVQRAILNKDVKIEHKSRIFGCDFVAKTDAGVQLLSDLQYKLEP